VGYERRLVSDDTSPLCLFSGILEALLQLGATLRALRPRFLNAVGVASLVESLEGFEPSTRCLEGSRSVQLSYRDDQTKYSMIGWE
jgi:hypothetical protein